MHYAILTAAGGKVMKFLKISKQKLIPAAVAAAVVVLLAALQVEKSYGFEYPSLQAYREVRIWGVPVYIEKNETSLSDFIKRKRIAVPAEKNSNFTVSKKIISIKGIERICGGVGNDLSKLCYLFKEKHISEAELLNVLNLLFQKKFDKFQQESWKLLYRSCL